MRMIERADTRHAYLTSTNNRQTGRILPGGFRSLIRILLELILKKSIHFSSLTVVPQLYKGE